MARRGNYVGLPRRSASALSKAPELVQHIKKINQEGGKVIRAEPAAGGATRLTYCSKKGPGHRDSLVVTSEAPVPLTRIRRHLAGLTI